MIARRGVNVAVALLGISASARAETPEPRGAFAPIGSPERCLSGIAEQRTGDPPVRWSRSAVFAELSVGFVPVANDVPLIFGAGWRVDGVHEIWARIGYMPTGDDVGFGFGVVGYRAALSPGKWLRPIVGAYLAGLPSTCTHDDRGRPSCTSDRLFIVSATGGLRIEPSPWVGVSALLSLGADSYPNPFGMIEVATTFTLPTGD